jgi:hypothetical protein
MTASILGMILFLMVYSPFSCMNSRELHTIFYFIKLDAARNPALSPFRASRRYPRVCRLHSPFPVNFPGENADTDCRDRSTPFPAGEGKRTAGEGKRWGRN